MVLVTIFLTGIPLLVYAALWMILKERPTSGVIDV
jgi:phage shock protein PspC (stress-responsive transcriptional regulator)